MYSGSYLHAVDQKGRIAMPARFREALGDTFILTKGPDGCLWALGNQEWRIVLGRAAKSLVVQRFFIASAVECKLARKGRFLVPDVLREHADIRPGDDAAIIGLGNRIEIWSRRRWEAVSSQVTSERVRQELPEFFEI